LQADSPEELKSDQSLDNYELLEWASVMRHQFAHLQIDEALLGKKTDLEVRDRNTQLYTRSLLVVSNPELDVCREIMGDRHIVEANERGVAILRAVRLWVAGLIPLGVLCVWISRGGPVDG